MSEFMSILQSHPVLTTFVAFVLYFGLMCLTVFKPRLRFPDYNRKRIYRNRSRSTGPAYYPMSGGQFAELNRPIGEDEGYG